MRGQQGVYISAWLCIYIYICPDLLNLLRQETIIIKAYKTEAIIIEKP